MSKEDIIKLAFEGFKEDMEFMYKNAGLSEDEIRQHLMQGEGSFLFICNNLVERLLEKNVLNIE